MLKLVGPFKIRPLIKNLPSDLSYGPLSSILGIKVSDATAKALLSCITRLAVNLFSAFNNKLNVYFSFEHLSSRILVTLLTLGTRLNL